MRWGELVDSDPSFIGAMDASTDGMGGIWFDTLGKLPLLLWRQPFPEAVTKEVVSWENPAGKFTNSDLEQAGLVCQPDILAQQHDIRERTICVLSNNTPAISRNHRGSTLSTLHQPTYAASPLYTKGPTATVYAAPTSQDP